MTYKDILVYADTTKAATARLNYAATMAKAHKAHLTALHVETRPFVPADILNTGMAAQVLQWQRELRRHQSEEVRAMVEAASQRNDINIEWRNVIGDIDDSILLHAHYQDLLVLSRDGDPLDLNEPIEPSPSNIVISSGRPIVVLPLDKTIASYGQRVLIAWKSTPEAARAVHDALPILTQAKVVTVMEVNPAQPADQHIAGSDIAQHLARHGVRVNVAPIYADDMDAGNLILTRADDLEADMIVMGAYGHSRLREIVLGGVTRHILENATIPVLLSR